MSNEPARMAMPAGWWRRNRWALLGLVALIPLALVASSFRLLVAYLPWTYDVAHRSAAGPVHLQQTYNGNERDITVDVTAALAGLTSSTTAGDIEAVPGATLWQVTFNFSADPDVVLQGCEIWLVDAQNREYGTYGGKDSKGFSDLGNMPTCVPRNSEGPMYDYFANEITPSQNPRPRDWTYTAYLAMPIGVEPAKVRLAWHEPDFIEFDAP